MSTISFWTIEQNLTFLIVANTYLPDSFVIEKSSIPLISPSPSRKLKILVPSLFICNYWISYKYGNYFYLSHLYYQLGYKWEECQFWAWTNHHSYTMHKYVKVHLYHTEGSIWIRCNNREYQLSTAFTVKRGEAGRAKPGNRPRPLANTCSHAFWIELMLVELALE